MSVKICKACDKEIPSEKIVFTKMPGTKISLPVCKECLEAFKACGAIK
jgi:hypothetical protein